MLIAFLFVTVAVAFNLIFWLLGLWGYTYFMTRFEYPRFFVIIAGLFIWVDKMSWIAYQNSIGFRWVPYEAAMMFAICGWHAQWLGKRQQRERPRL